MRGQESEDMADRPSVILEDMDDMPPAAKWRCWHCGIAFTEFWAFGVDGAGTVEMGLKCKRCKEFTKVIRRGV